MQPKGSLIKNLVTTFFKQNDKQRLWNWIFLLILQARFMRSLFLNIVRTKARKPLARCDSKQKDLTDVKRF